MVESLILEVDLYADVRGCWPEALGRALHNVAQGHAHGKTRKAAVDNQLR